MAEPAARIATAQLDYTWEIQQAAELVTLTAEGEINQKTTIAGETTPNRATMLKAAGQKIQYSRGYE